MDINMSDSSLSHSTTGACNTSRQAEVVRCWGYLITSKLEGDYLDSLALTKDRAWEKFCYPALRREAYEAKGSGFRAKRVRIERVKINGKLIRASG